MQSNRKIIIVVILSFVLFSVLIYLRPERPDWSMSFSSEHKRPYGGYIAYEILSQGKKVVTSRTSTYYNFDLKESRNSAYMVVTDYFQPDEWDVDALVNFVKNGNTAFIVSQRFDYHFRNDILNVGMDYGYNDKYDLTLYDASEYIFEKKQGLYYFYDIPGNAEVIAYNSDMKVTMIRLPYGDGYFIVGSMPLLFTNYKYVKSSDNSYLIKMFSLLEHDLIIWDEYYKPVSVYGVDSLFFIKSNEHLKSAYYLLLFFIVCYIVIHAKRVQRVIPVYEKPRNEIMRFVENAGLLLYSKKCNAEVAQLLIRHLHRYVHRYYKIDIFEEVFEGIQTGRTVTLKPSAKIIAKDIAQKSGAETSTVEKLFRVVKDISSRKKIPNKMLAELDDAIYNFQYKARMNENE